MSFCIFSFDEDYLNSDFYSNNDLEFQKSDDGKSGEENLEKQLYQILGKQPNECISKIKN